MKIGQDLMIVIYQVLYHFCPQNPWKNKGFGHLKTRLFTTKTSKHVGFWGATVLKCGNLWTSHSAHDVLPQNLPNSKLWLQTIA